MRSLLKRLAVLMLAIIMLFSLTIPAFAKSTTEFVVEQSIVIPGDEPTNPDALHFEWLYSTTKPSGATYSSTASVTTGNTKLQQTLDSILLSVLASGLMSVVPINNLARTLAGAILGALPVAFNGSTTLYYRVYTYMGTGAYQFFNKKCVVYYYYDKDRTQFASSATYYGQKA